MIKQVITKVLAFCMLILLSACNSGSSSSASSQASWAWMDGSNQIGAAGVYGTKGVASASNIPGARDVAISWVDGSGNFYLFGGSPDGVSGLNDLWQYSANTHQWTWVSGESTANVHGIYGTLGVMSPSNMPGSRFGGVSFKGNGNNLWLFGGFGLAESGISGNLNDLWMYSESQNQWVWVSGSNSTGESGVYGTQGIPSADNIPGARIGSVSWVDANGNLWLFGGSTTLVDTSSVFNDLWQYNISSGEWTWISGESTTQAFGVYGVQGVAASYTVPGARLDSMSWMDSSGNLWLFGGQGIDANMSAGSLNDLWQYNPTLNQWTWMSGSNQNGALGVYGIQGVSSPNSIPGSRHHRSPISYAANSNTFYMFGGYGYGSGSTAGDLNDLWSYNVADNQWTWLGGSSQINASGSYGQLGIPSATNIPGAREDAVGWIDTNGKLWLFGGSGYDGSSNSGYLNDLWQYLP